MVFGAVNTVCSGNIRWKKDSDRLRAGSIHYHFKCVTLHSGGAKVTDRDDEHCHFIILRRFEGFHLDMESRSLTMLKTNVLA